MKTKKCKYCNEEIAKNLKKCPKCGGKLGMPSIVKILIVVIIIIVGFVGCVSSCTNSVDKAVKEVKNEYLDINGKTEFKVNETFQNKYEKITMTEVNTNFKDYDEYSEPKSGYKYVMAKFEIENINEENDELYVSSYEYNATADDVAVEEAYVGNDKYNDFTATIGKGKKTIGYVFYEVPKDAKSIEIDYEANFWTDGNAIKFIVQ